MSSARQSQLFKVHNVDNDEVSTFWVNNAEEWRKLLASMYFATSLMAAGLTKRDYEDEEENQKAEHECYLHEYVDLRLESKKQLYLQLQLDIERLQVNNDHLAARLFAEEDK